MLTSKKKKKKTTTRHDINTFYRESKNHSYKRVNRGNFSKQRTHINPEFFKEVNRNYLTEIKFNENLSIHKKIQRFPIIRCRWFKNII